MNSSYNFDFSKSWSQLKEEAEKPVVSSLPDGKYVGLITSASFQKNKVGYDVVQLKIKVLKPNQFANVEINKNFTLDKNYPYSSSQTKAFVILLCGFDLSFNDLPTLATTLNHLWVKADKFVKIKAELRNIPGVADKITTYKIEALDSVSKNIDKPTSTIVNPPSISNKSHDKPISNRNEELDIYDDLFEQ